MGQSFTGRKIHELHISERFLNAWPRPNLKVLKGLERELLADGCCDPIVINEHGVILDGYSRHELCMANDIPFTCRVKQFQNDDDAHLWILGHQENRRNATDAERAAAALSYEEIVRAEALLRSQAGKKIDPSLNLDRGSTDDVLANLVGVSKSAIQKTRTIMADGAAKVQQMALAGDVSLDAAATISQAPKAEQAAVARKGPRAVKAKAKAMKESKRQSYTDAVMEKFPPKLHQPFINAQEFDVALYCLRQIVEIVNRIAGDGKGIEGMAGGEILATNYARIRKALSDVRVWIDGSRPYGACPYCLANGRCDVCKGRGWTCESQYKSAPPEKQEKAKEMKL